MKSSNDGLTKEQSKAIKAQQKLEKELNRLRKESKEQEYVNVLCVRFGTRYGRDYVERLRNMVAKHLTVPYRFYCLTDDNYTISGVTNIVQKNAGYVKGWWHKVHMFDPMLPLSGRILYFDLDVVIHRNVDKLVRGLKQEFYGIRDFNRKFHNNWKILNSSTMTWIHGSQTKIYQEFLENTSSAMKLHGDQDWIWKVAKDRINFWPDKWIQSYKWEIRNREELLMRTGSRGFTKIRDDVVPHSDCCVAVFHGDPKPQDVKDSFVVENWK